MVPVFPRSYCHRTRRFIVGELRKIPAALGHLNRLLTITLAFPLPPLGWNSPVKSRVLAVEPWPPKSLKWPENAVSTLGFFKVLLQETFGTAQSMAEKGCPERARASDRVCRPPICLRLKACARSPASPARDAVFEAVSTQKAVPEGLDDAQL